MRNLIITIAIIAIFLEISGLIWSTKGDRPSETYIRLTQAPEKHIQTALQNGYFMMVGFAMPIQTTGSLTIASPGEASYAS